MRGTEEAKNRGTQFVRPDIENNARATPYEQALAPPHLHTARKNNKRDGSRPTVHCNVYWVTQLCAHFSPVLISSHRTFNSGSRTSIGANIRLGLPRASHGPPTGHGPRALGTVHLVHARAWPDRLRVFGHRRARTLELQSMHTEHTPHPRATRNARPLKHLVYIKAMNTHEKCLQLHISSLLDHYETFASHNVVLRVIPGFALCSSSRLC